MNACPYCGVPAISWYRKLRLGLVRSAICDNCGEKVVVSKLPFMGVTLMTSFFVVTLIIVVSLPLLAMIVLLIVIMIISSVLHVVIVPLVPFEGDISKNN